MTATDELRKFAWKECPSKFLERVIAIADRIDAEAKDNERFRREAEPFCDRLREAAAQRADATLFGVDYVALPLDADGKAICVGDEVEYLDEPHVCRVVTSIDLAHDGWWVYVGGTGRRPGKYRHHHELTVEDVLREFAEKMNENLGMYTGEVIDADEWRDADAKTVAEYAASLRLAGEGA